ncbi:hypothetical protein GEMRC1_009437 [Eukaryota sp. GEM-RC1]
MFSDFHDLSLNQIRRVGLFYDILLKFIGETNLESVRHSDQVRSWSNRLTLDGVQQLIDEIHLNIFNGIHHWLKSPSSSKKVLVFLSRVFEHVRMSPTQINELIQLIQCHSAEEDIVLMRQVNQGLKVRDRKLRDLHEEARKRTSTGESPMKRTKVGDL